MTRRELLAGAAAQLASRRKPNIVFILADDLGCFDVGCYGQKLIRTPNIDRLAAEGTRFTQAYAGATVCAPSRCSLMTGKHQGHAAIRANHSLRNGDRVPLPAGERTVAEILKQAGYTTGIFGKWGLGEPGTEGVPNRQGFDDWFGFLNQDHAVHYYTDHLWRNERKELLKGNQNGQRNDYATELFTREAERFIRANRTRPFFLYLPYTSPHFDLEAPDDGPYAAMPWSQDLKTLAAMVTYMDTGIGRVMALLRELRLDQDTVVFFASDNGAGHKAMIPFFKSTGTLRGAKGEVYEGGIRTPMIARWPGKITAGRVDHTPWAFWDFLPTAAELAGAPLPPSGIDGVSMAGRLTGGPPPKRDYLYWESWRTRRFDQAVRIGDWKAVRLGKGPVELYNLAQDESEAKDLAAEKPELVARAREIFRTARTDIAEYPVEPPARKR